MNGVTDPSDSYALLIVALSSPVLEISAPEISDSGEKIRFPELNSRFGLKFAVMLNITRIAFKDLFITIKIRPSMTNSVNLTGSYRAIYAER